MKRLLLSLITIVVLGVSLAAQTTEFTYQGRLLDGALPPTANYDFEFRLFSADTNGTLLGSESRPGVVVTSGVFTVRLDFGTIPNSFDGAERWLEIAVRPAGGPTFTTLNPRQPISSSPYSIRSLNSNTANTATNSIQLGGVAAGQYVITTDPRMTDSRMPTAGSNNYIQNNPLSQQTNSSFNIAGTGTANVFSATTQYNIGSNRILSTNGTDNLFAGVGAGGANASGERNSFFGAGAGQANTDGSFNAFFGSNAGLNNATGSLNAFFGRGAGFANIAGGDNAFFGTNAGANTTGSRNSFFGRSSGQGNIDGSDNVFVGMFAGNANSTGNNNTIIGTSADLGANNLSFATAIGAGASVGTDNTVVLGRVADTVQIPGNLSVGGSISPAIIPTGAVMFFQLAACPSGWSELAEARGRYLVGLPLGGTLGATQGTALSNLEDRPTGQHGHSINPFSHSHTTHGHFANVTVQRGSTVDVAGALGGLPQTSFTSLSISNSGNVAGTNAPYLQLLVCKKD